MNDYKGLITDIAGAMLMAKVMGRDSMAKVYSRAADAIEQLVKERDAALEDVIVHCDTCRHGMSCDRVYQCYGGTEDEYLKWEWRGVQEDNDENC